jgi:hypothetical protein
VDDLDPYLQTKLENDEAMVESSESITQISYILSRSINSAELSIPPALVARANILQRSVSLTMASKDADLWVQGASDLPHRIRRH